MVQRYAHLAPTHLAHHAENVKITSMSELETKQPPLLAADRDDRRRQIQDFYVSTPVEN